MGVPCLFAASRQYVLDSRVGLLFREKIFFLDEKFFCLAQKILKLIFSFGERLATLFSPAKMPLPYPGKSLNVMKILWTRHYLIPHFYRSRPQSPFVRINHKILFSFRMRSNAKNLYQVSSKVPVYPRPHFFTIITNILCHCDKSTSLQILIFGEFSTPSRNGSSRSKNTGR